MEILGKSLIWLATASAAASLFLYVFRENLSGYARWAHRVCTASLVGSISLLLTLLLTHRFEFLYVRNYSSTDLPLYYLIATLWGGQEGTLLLWIVYTSLLGLILSRMAGRLERYSMATISLFILSILVILIKRSPFEATSVGPTEGAGLNPLLQDFWMTIHPPIMFLGFALTVFPFAVAVAGYVRGEYRQWSQLAWVWLIGAWCTLGTALVMGGYWAYKVLGWGGYWAWDPVENSSLIPWIFATGGIHSLVMFKKKNALARSAFLFSILPFIAVLFGSFLTRSGVLGDFSVHSFLDLGINSFLVALLALFGVIGFGVLFWRFRKVRATVAYSSMSTVDFFVSIAVLSFLVAGALVLIGMSTPLWTRLGGPPSNVTLSYYFMATTPVALILLFGLSVFPFMRWIKPSKPFIDPKAAFPFFAAILAAAVALFSGIEEVLYLILVGLGAFAAASNGWLIYDRLRTKGKLNGAYVAHVGLALLIVGAAVSSAYEKKEQVALPLNQPVEKFGWILTYQGRGAEEGSHQTPYHVAVEREGWDKAFLCSPRQFTLPDKGVMRKPAVKKFWNKDLYISPLGLEGEEGEMGNVIALERAQTSTVGALDLTFLGFDMDDHGSSSRVGCQIEITSDMVIDTVVTMIEGTPEGLRGVPIDFAEGRYTFTVDKIDATKGAISLRVIDNHSPAASAPVFWIELAEKPLINLFWMGTTLMVFGGLLVLRKRAGLWSPSPETPAEEASVREDAPAVAEIQEISENAKAPQLR